MNKFSKRPALRFFVGGICAAAAIAVSPNVLVQRAIAQDSCPIRLRSGAQLTCALVYEVTGGQVERTRRNATSIFSRGQTGTLLPADRLRSVPSAIAKLQFNEGSVARTLPGTRFEFRRGAAARDILVVRNGAVFIGTSARVAVGVRTPEAAVFPSGSIAQQPYTIAQKSLSPGADHPHRQPSLTLAQDALAQNIEGELPSIAYVVQRDEISGVTEVFALTNSDGPLVVEGQGEEPPAELRAGERVKVTPAGLQDIETFDLQSFYARNPLVADIAPGQDMAAVQGQLQAQNLSPDIQGSVLSVLSAIQVETAAAVNRQNRGFSRSFVPTALTGADADFRERVRPSENRRDRPDVEVPSPSNNLGDIFDEESGEGPRLRDPIEPRPGELDPQQVEGTFLRLTDNGDGNDTGVFAIPVSGELFINVPITVDFDEREITIGGVGGRASAAGISGDRAFGTVTVEDGGVVVDANGIPQFELERGESVQVEIFDVNGREPNVGEPFSGRLIRGIVPDR